MSDATGMQKNAFKVMMQASGAPSKKPAVAKDEKDPIVTAVIYRRWLEHVDEAEPLWRIPYFGQAVRFNISPQALAETRWKEEDYDAKREDKEIGLIAVLDCFGKDAMDNKVLEHRTGPRSVVQAWADQREKELIAEAGGTLRDMDKRLRQTLNILKGGKGATWWASMDAFRAKRFNNFKREMEEFVEENHTAQVPSSYVNPTTGYKLGSQLNQFRQGILRNGAVNQKAIEDWAASLPKWAWNVHEANTERFKLELEEYVARYDTSRVPQSYMTESGWPLGKALADFRQSNATAHNVGLCHWVEGLPMWTWNCVDAAFDDFKAAIEAFVAETGTSVVPYAYINSSGYKLGTTLSGFRKGRFRNGKDDKAEIEEWAESLPNWSWNGFSTTEFWVGNTLQLNRGRDIRSNLVFTRFKDEMEMYVAETGTSLVPKAYVNNLTGYNLGSQLANFRSGRMRHGRPNRDAIEAWANSLPNWAWRIRIPNIKKQRVASNLSDKKQRVVYHSSDED